MRWKLSEITNPEVKRQIMEKLRGFSYDEPRTKKDYLKHQKEITALPKAKYRNRKTVVNGIMFDSKKEADRYLELLALCVQDLKLQFKLPIVINGIKICTYIADFAYYKNDIAVYEDVKGFRTPVYRLKKKLVKAVYGIKIKEV